jgi:hypothetical protein
MGVELGLTLREEHRLGMRKISGPLRAKKVETE